MNLITEFTEEDVSQIISIISNNERLRNQLVDALSCKPEKIKRTNDIYSIPLKDFLGDLFDRQKIMKRSYLAFLRSLCFLCKDKGREYEYYDKYTVGDMICDYGINNFNDMERFFRMHIRNCGQLTSKDLRQAFESELKGEHEECHIQN